MENIISAYSYELEGLLRLLLAAMLGGIMGLERTRKRREAGFRTYMLVALGAAMTMMVGEMVVSRFGSGDPTRIAAQAVSGIGFIGAGSILVSRSNRVMGLTTAAGIWVSVTVGLAVGCGYYMGGIAVVVISIIITMLGDKIQRSFLRHSDVIRIAILFQQIFNKLSIHLIFIPPLPHMNFKSHSIQQTDKLLILPHPPGNYSLFLRFFFIF